MSRKKIKPECHPNRAHYAKGLCASCYHARAAKKKKKQPVRVIHTHEVVRQVQQQPVTMATQQEEKDEQSFFAGKVKEQEQERKHTMTATKDAEAEKPRETTRGYSGDPTEGEAPPYVQNLPEDSVISPVGVTRPPEPGIMDPYYKERTDDEQFAGKVLMKGKTHHGYYYERIVDVLQPRTKGGILQILEAHFPDLDRESFACEAVSDEEAVKKEKEWADKLRGKEKGERDKKAKAQEGGSSTKKEPDNAHTKGK